MIDNLSSYASLFVIDIFHSSSSVCTVGGTVENGMGEPIFHVVCFRVEWEGTIPEEDKGVFPLDVGLPSNRPDGSVHLGTTRVNLSMEASASICEEEEEVGRMQEKRVSVAYGA